MNSLSRTLAGLYFFLRTLPLRGRFMTGKASFVEALVAAAHTDPSYLVDQAGRSVGSKMLSHYSLQTRRPRTGTQGWELFAEAAEARLSGTVVSLECAYCGHVYIIRVLPPTGAPLFDGAEAPAPGTPASYNTDWFGFMHEDFVGESFISCRHCEQKNEPRVVFLSIP